MCALVTVVQTFALPIFGLGLAQYRPSARHQRLIQPPFQARHFLAQGGDITVPFDSLERRFQRVCFHFVHSLLLSKMRQSSSTACTRASGCIGKVTSEISRSSTSERTRPYRCRSAARAR